MLTEAAHRRQEVERKVGFVPWVSYNNNETVASHNLKLMPRKFALCECLSELSLAWNGFIVNFPLYTGTAEVAE
jgi:hypothetical protein